ncbi:Mannonate dehydratase [Alloiococcus otitis]|uniref:Mannonate dehydratase n=1 Tax=Alloiococcus otitis ATCC 51267 TaxID=883081 RepID=K9EDK4_9LACT|nr:mannonate dehydratase [Alloiococcus otitis]EKU93901.1 mannonate dehydratase [Alloiococcus otitis ATCC 51267]SUU81711.1 Mannonate dehydratase [Alloiococcus otitis]
MKMSFRWYGTDDPVSLQEIREIPGMQGIVSAVYDISVGEVWPAETIQALKDQVEAAGLELVCIESVPVHEDIKLGKESRDQLIANYKETIRIIGQVGIPVVCYNFMPVFDWTRSDLSHPLPDGSHSLALIKADIEDLDPLSGDLTLPGWDLSYDKEGLKEVMDDYKGISKEDLWDNLAYFIKEIIPVAEEAQVKMAIHPDDPPYDIFGLPRIIVDLDAVKRFLDLYDSKYNGITMCVGSYASSEKNDVAAITEYALKRDRINFMHMRNVAVGSWGFQETAHLSEAGSIDMNAIIKLLVDYGWTGPLRPDHGRQIWHDQVETPGYGLYDRALGATYLNGLYEANMKALGKNPHFDTPKLKGE